MKKDRIERLLEVCQDGIHLSAWEESFVESILKQLTRGRTPSVKQVNIIHRIEAKVEKLRKGDPEWECLWDEEKAWNFRTAVAYYTAAPERYFSQILDWFKHNPDKIPPQNYYKKIVENKYAQKVITNLRREPKYPSGSAVTLRKGARVGLSYSKYYDHLDVPLFVVEPTEKAVSAAAGCRIYIVLSSVSSQVFEVEERFIKKWRKGSSKGTISSDVPF
ncbi:MAG: hypothetical protein GOVbin630_159 [Prokaryotic dsDNA virus sp.]|nr:MAG: hypothetical protein GOVbin630_159 [Prokaryotic dsDNA virus sp.]|tara:strand:- start:18172 stop:18828 length:657 start_codon:yes stop_codon:yes gene_type:complete